MRRWAEKASTGIFLATTAILVLVMGAMSLSFRYGEDMNEVSPTHIDSEPPCRNPSIRREWRALTDDEKTHFTEAVKCLSTVPSQWTGNGTLYDDFTALHSRIGTISHKAAAFLPWHRYTLHIWETALRENCGFDGQIPFVSLTSFPELFRQLLIP